MMQLTRRGWFATLLAPFVARFLPAPAPAMSPASDLMAEKVNDFTLQYLRESKDYENFVSGFFQESPLLVKLRGQHAASVGDPVFWGGDEIQEVFLTQDEEPTMQPTTPACQIHKPSEEWAGAN